MYTAASGQSSGIYRLFISASYSWLLPNEKIA